VGALVLTTAATAAADDDTTLDAYWKSGLRMDTADKQFRLKIGGRIMNDWVWWDASDELETGVGDDIEDGTEFRRARLYIAGEVYEHVIFKAQYDFAGGDAAFKDVFVGLKDIPVVGIVRVGHFKEPFSLEELTSSKYITFMERSLPNAFAPSRNTGLGFLTTLLDERMTLAAGVFRETDDFGDDTGDTYQFAGRATGTPLFVDDGEQLVHLGFSYRHTNADSDELRFRQRPEVHISPRFVDTDAFAADSANTYDFEAAAVFGPLSVQGEYMLADVDSSATGDPTFDGWYAYATWFLTGEHRVYDAAEGAFDRVKPHRNFLQGGPGAFELGVRYSTIDLDDGEARGGELDDITAGLNWYLNPNTRVMLNYVRADVDGVGEANAFQTRFQIDF
jgi:phosphate-selective porin OprO/OprP